MSLKTPSHRGQFPIEELSRSIPGGRAPFRFRREGQVVASDFEDSLVYEPYGTQPKHLRQATFGAEAYICSSAEAWPSWIKSFS